ncbi:MAG: hypothetical protein ABIP53_00740 [Candidatus Limnocylindrales bacterium]
MSPTRIPPTRPRCNDFAHEPRPDGPDRSSFFSGPTALVDTLVEEIVVLHRPGAVGSDHDVELEILIVEPDRRRPHRLLKFRYQHTNSRLGPLQKCCTATPSPSSSTPPTAISSR